MRVRNRLHFVFLFFVAAACSFNNDGGILISSSIFDFNENEHGWEHGFSDYPASKDDSAFYELTYAYTDRPPGLSSGKAIKLSGNNHSNDLFMFLKKKLTGLRSNAHYTITFNVEFASNAQVGSVGTAGENVYFKVGATSIEPKSLIDNGYYVMNIDKGNGVQGGSDMFTIGNIAIAENNQNYMIIERSNTALNHSSLEVRSNNDGELWLIVGTDSGFEGITTIYYTKITVLLTFKE